MEEKRQIAIIGFKSSGKSTVGRILAKKLGRPFQDTDEILESLYEKKEGKRLTFREIYVRHGRGYFENLEEEAIREAFNGEGKVISFGGGSITTADAKGLKLDNAIFIYLTASPDVLFNRIVANGIPAFFTTEDPRSSFDSLLEKRRPIYEKYADITVDSSYYSAEDTVEIALKELKEKGVQ